MEKMQGNKILYFQKIYNFGHHDFSIGVIYFISEREAQVLQ